MLKRLTQNRYFGWIFNICYILGIIISFDRGWGLKFLLISTLIIAVVYWKPLYGIMKQGGDLYADWCYKISNKTVGKLNPWKEIKEKKK